MAVHKIDIDDFIIQAPHSLIIDVRSPGEFDHAHIVSALNLPLFTNEERAIVGTTYKKQSREAAIKVGLPLFGTKLLPMIETVEKWVSEKQEGAHTTKPNILVHCWRGGMRSAAVAWLLDLYGYKVEITWSCSSSNVKGTNIETFAFGMPKPPLTLILPQTTP